ncbi:RNA-guided endonuclease TnpB family protein [Streptomyces sp. 2A115]|uniref:RNA-guided endonuclease TnpB family protein n=1 Tax=Streptomyces sp. 2A115 TaxID=3457439 RepID=UPI003FD0DCA1
MPTDLWRRTLADVALLWAEPAVFGPVASDPTVSRLVGQLASGGKRVLAALRAARAEVREHVWRLAGNAAPDAGGQVIVDLDGVLVRAHSEKQDAAATWKKTFGHHPLMGFVDHGRGGSGEPVVGLLRPGNAGSNTAADHIEATKLALAQLPKRLRRGRQTLIRTDSGGGTHAFVAWLARRGRWLSYSVGMTITDAVHQAVLKVPASAWTPAVEPDGDIRDGARLARAQRELSRTAQGEGTNRAKARRKVAKVHARIADRRRDMLHKLTTGLVRDNQTLVIEDLTVRTMVKNHSLARAIPDASWSEFRSMLEYKAAWYGRQVIAVDRFFPSSRLCSVCGTVQEKMPLSVCRWACGCGAVHDRDVNAANNLLAAGLAVSVCGAGARPQRSSPGGQSAVKQKTPRREP